MAQDTSPVQSDVPTRVIAALGGDVSDQIKVFTQHLFVSTDETSLAAYAIEDLATYARALFDRFAHRGSGGLRPVIRRDGLDGGICLEVLHDNMPFLVDSVIGELQARDLGARIVLHPIFDVERSPQGTLQALSPRTTRKWQYGNQESLIIVHLVALDEADEDDLIISLASILEDVSIVVADWPAMLDRLKEALAAAERSPPNVPGDVMREHDALIEWLIDGHFTFLGMRDYDLVGDAKTGDLKLIPESGLGLLRDPELLVLRRGNRMVQMTAETRRLFFRPMPLIVTKANVVSRVHRRSHMDYIGIKLYRRDGTPSGELRIIGLFTSQAYNQSVQSVPFLRHKVAAVLKAAGHDTDSHAGKALLNVLETFPRDELLQIGTRQLRNWTAGILDLELRPRTRVFVRVDRFDRFVSVLVFVRRDRSGTVVRGRIGRLLAEVYDGRISAVYPFFMEGPLVRTQYIVARYDGPTPDIDKRELEVRVDGLVQTWQDKLARAIRDDAAPSDCRRLIGQYADAFPAGYAETFDEARALEDIARIERLGPQRPVAIDFYRETHAPPNRVRVAIYRFDGPISLSQRVPILENLGFSVIDERSYHVVPVFGDVQRNVNLHDMVLETRDGDAIDLAKHELRLEDGFLAVFDGVAADDAYNGLIVAAGADWRQATVFRALGAYLRQLGAPFGRRYLAETLARHHSITRNLLALFQARFDPDSAVSPADRQSRQSDIAGDIEAELADVPSLEEDRILRQVMNLILAAVRTDFYCLDAQGGTSATIAFKFASRQIDMMPLPKPLTEMWVFGPEVEGVHLRFAPIARGGIRWSDRAGDFRTEVLGLVKAQQVKNAVIVPYGAKGGYFPKQLPPASAGRDALRDAGLSAYRCFISTLLGLVDNLKGSDIVVAERVVRHDADDPYLVVAADKGTATFSDTANEIAAEHGLWLDDAFASGGSAGYDHKKMGITSRGAWECVKRHFREMDKDIQNEPFSAVGIGDMSGDVFGNGMLRSRQTRLIAAFDHRDIFIDPDPDPQASYLERARLFALARSSWQDYDTSKISAGGGVFPRSAKSILLSAQAADVLGLDEGPLTPTELIRAVMCAQADLLWFGGIGTYVRAADESDDAAGDRANDALRITADQLRVKVVGEGANLGVTQAARIDFAARGGRINADFIDNSAGVNCSDQEVNIKIALSAAMSTGKLDRAARNALLIEMTDDVAAACLRNNYLQTLAISLGARRGLADLGFQQRLMRSLERSGELNRAIEYLPTDAEIAERYETGMPLTRPELAVLLSYAKLDLLGELLASRVPDDPVHEPLLTTYFPKTLIARFGDEVSGHRLRREIIATELTNAIINRGGSTMVVRLMEETGRSVADIVEAFVAAQAVFGLQDVWARIDDLDNKLSGNAQLDLYQKAQGILREKTAWFLRHRPDNEALSTLIARHSDGLKSLSENLDDVLTPERAAEMESTKSALSDAGVPEALAAELAVFVPLSDGPDIIAVASEADCSVAKAAQAFFEVGDYFRLAALQARARGLSVTDTFDRLAINAAMSMISDAQRLLSETVLGSGADGFERWLDAEGDGVVRARASMDEVAGATELTVSRLTVAAGQLRDLAQARQRASFAAE